MLEQEKEMKIAVNNVKRRKQKKKKSFRQKYIIKNLLHAHMDAEARVFSILEKKNPPRISIPSPSHVLLA